MELLTFAAIIGFFVARGCLMHHKMLSSILDFYPLDASSTPPPFRANKNVSRHYQMSPKRQKSTKIENNSIKGKVLDQRASGKNTETQIYFPGCGVISGPLNSFSSNGYLVLATLATVLTNIVSGLVEVSPS